MTKETNNNRDNLITMIAISEDIYRTNNRICELLRGLMANPHELTNIKKSIDNLYEKVTALKNSDIGTALIEKEDVVVPGPDDASPKENIRYEESIQTPPEPEEAEAGELVAKKLPPGIPRTRKNNKRRRPTDAERKSLISQARKTSTKPNLQDQ